MTSEQKEDIEELQKKQKEKPDALTPKEKQMLKLATGVFLEPLGQYAIQKIKQKNPKIEVVLQTLMWAKEELEALWSKTANRTLLLVNAVNAEMGDIKTCWNNGKKSSNWWPSTS